MNFTERFDKWKQDKREFHTAFREAVIVVARHKSPHATEEQLLEHANLVVFATETCYEEVTGMPIVEIGVIPPVVTAADMKTVIGRVVEGDDRPVEWGNLFGESSIDNTIQVSARGARLLGEYHEEGITSTLLDPKPDSVKFPIIDGAGNYVGDEVIYKTVVVEPTPVEQVVPRKPFSLCRPDDVRDVNVSTGDEVEIKPVPSAPYERAVVASDLWRMIVDEGEVGRTNSWVEQYFERLQEKYYGKIFLRISVKGLTVIVFHLTDDARWVKL